LVGIKKLKTLKKNNSVNPFLNAIKIVTFVTLLFSSCKKDGLLLENNSRDGFTGEWAVNETNSIFDNDSRNYLIEITENPNYGERIKLFNLYKLGYARSVFANISAIESNTVTIPSQIHGFNTIEGFGILSKNEIDFTYYVHDGNEIDTVIAHLKR
jgi:hypothetical protein|tara:strand:- start:2941 stop:3408 length:468 start_codon:yes stop_codon:yes gene_type:complete